jgi:enoyl-CoA hydratase/carnithine racemase
MLSGARYGADDALRLGIADATSAEGALVTAAAERAAALAGKNPATVSGIKAGLYGEIVAKLREPIAT